MKFSGNTAEGGIILPREKEWVDELQGKGDVRVGS